MLHGCPLKSASMLLIRMHKISIHQSGSLSSPDTGTSLKSKHIFIVIPGKQDFHRYKKGKKKAAAPPDNIPEKLPLINYLFYYAICYLRLYLLHICTTRPLRASRAMALGITIRPLKKSAKSHTSSSFRAEPMIIQATTNKE